MIRSRTAWRCVALGNIADTAIGSHLMSYSYGEKRSKKECKFKGTTKFYFMCYLRVVMIFFSTGLYKSSISTYFFIKTSFSFFCVLVFRISVFFALSF